MLCEIAIHAISSTALTTVAVICLEGRYTFSIRTLVVLLVCGAGEDAYLFLIPSTGKEHKYLPNLVQLKQCGKHSEC